MTRSKCAWCGKWGKDRCTCNRTPLVDFAQSECPKSGAVKPKKATKATAQFGKPQQAGRSSLQPLAQPGKPRKAAPAPPAAPSAGRGIPAVKVVASTLQSSTATPGKHSEAETLRLRVKLEETKLARVEAEKSLQELKKRKAEQEQAVLAPQPPLREQESGRRSWHQKSSSQQNWWRNWHGPRRGTEYWHSMRNDGLN